MIYISILVARGVISHYNTRRHKARLCIHHEYDATLVCDAIRNMYVVLELVNGYINIM